jgi:hypothetical protein
MISAGQDDNSPNKVILRVDIATLAFVDPLDPEAIHKWLAEWELKAHKQGFEETRVIIRNREAVEFYSTAHDLLVITGLREETDEEFKRRQGHITAQKFHKVYNFRIQENFYATEKGKAEIAKVVAAYPNHKDLAEAGAPFPEAVQARKKAAAKERKNKAK